MSIVDSRSENDDNFVDPFLTAVHDARHDSPIQQHFRRIAPMPFGVVFLQRPEMTIDDIRAHMRQIRSLGFNALKQIMTCPGTTIAEVQHIALDAGIVPWWYGEGGWEPISDDLLNRLGIPLDSSIETIRTDSRMIDWQTRLLRDRIDGIGIPAVDGNTTAYPAAPIEFRHSPGVELDESLSAGFVKWLKEEYGTIENLNEAWNLRHVGIVATDAPWENWETMAANWRSLGKNEYRHLRDILRYKADLSLSEIGRRAHEARAKDKYEPVRAGGEMGLFLPFAARATDMEGIADTMTDVGSFYPSIHLAWHFEEVAFEMPRTVYMQASLAADWFKGGWSATWESTGGPQQLSGGKGWNPAGQAETAGFTVDAGTITQLLLSYLAAGFKGVGLWCWNARSAGWEAGEYSLLDRNEQITPRAIRAGQIASTANRLRDELWQARKEPLVGVFQDWDNEAIWATIAVSNREKYKMTPIQARVGIGRALIGGNLPWEYLTANDLRAGLAGRYEAIYLPAVIALNTDLLPIFHAYVENGGRLVLDMPGGWYDTFGRLLPTGTGSDFERLWGVTLNDFQYARNRPLLLGDLPLNGWAADVTPTAAQLIDCFDSKQPAVTENRIGGGTAVLLAYDAALQCFAPGNRTAEALLIEHLLGNDLTSPYSSEAVVYRLANPAADHYFFVNDAPARKVSLTVPGVVYSEITDALTQELLPSTDSIALEAYGGRWIRCEKSSE